MKTIIFILFCSVTIIIQAQEVTPFSASDGETLYYTKQGSGPRVVFLYGGPGYAVSAMKFWADSLSDEFECILFDQRGTGFSSNVKLDTSTINLKRALEDLDDLRLHLGEEKITLCGISWGGMFTQAYAANYPKTTEKIVLVSTLGPDLEGFSAFSDNMNMRRFPSERDSLKYWTNQPDSEYARMKRFYFNYIPEFYDHDIGNIMLKKFFATTKLNGQMSSLMWKDLYKNYDLKMNLADYKGEVIIIRPRQDPVPAEVIFQIRDLLPQTKLFFIEKCGHFPDYEKPKEFFRILKEIL
jgi:proline iminopeptidase